MTRSQFKASLQQFDKAEPARGKLYYLARKLIEKRFTLEAHILILATWNTAAFRYSARRFKLQRFEKAIREITVKFRALRGSDLMNTNLRPHKRSIIRSFNTLRKIKGVGVTGASKSLHLINPRLFVAWDNYISGQKLRTKFKNLQLVRSGSWPSKKFKRTGSGYYDFLVTCQENFRPFVFRDRKRTHAKQIDEFNFVQITRRLQAIERQKKKRRRK